MKKIVVIVGLILSACSPKNEQSPNFETKTEALATFEDTSTALADFGNPVTASTTRIFTFKNTGTTAGPATPTLSDSSFLIILQTGCATVNPGSTCTVRVNFNPSGKSVGTYTSTLTIAGTVTKELTAVVAAGTTGGSTTGGTTGSTTGGTSGVSGNIEASIFGVVISNPLDYGSFTGTQNATKIITLKNIGTTSTGVQSAALSDTDFTFTLNGCNNKTLAPNGTCSVRVTFNATGKIAQDYLTDLTFGTATFPLKATVAGAGTTTGGSTTGGTTSGGAAVISFLDGTTSISSPYSIGSTTTTSITKIITIKNTGTVSTGPHTAALSDTDITFVLNSCSNKTLAAGGSCTVRVTFNPSGKTSGDHSSTLTFGAGTIDLTATKSGLVCNSGEHIEGGVCVSDIQSCTIVNGTGQKTWNGNSYGSCQIVSCNLNFEQVSNQCMAQCTVGKHRDPISLFCVNDTRNCIPMPTNANAGTQTWNSTTQVWGSCNVTGCIATFHTEDNLSCISNVRSCTTALPSNATAGEETWSGTWGTCMATACEVGYQVSSGACVPDNVQYTLNVNNSPYGTITGDAPGTANDFVCDGTCTGVIKTLNANDEVTLTFIPNDYYYFISWGGLCASNPCILNMNTNLIVTPPTVGEVLPSSLTLMINSGESSTTSFSATLNISAVDATEMAISTTTCDTSTNAAWEPYATTKAVTLVNGLNEFFVAFRNPATASSSCAQASITKNSSGGGADTTPPQLLVYGPQSFAPISTGVSVEFNEDIDGTTVNGDTFKICTNGGLTCSIPATLNQVSARRFLLTPNSLLTKDVTYTVKIGQGATPIKDLALNDFAGHSWDFIAQQGWITYSLPGAISSDYFNNARSALGYVFYTRSANPSKLYRAEGGNETFVANINPSDNFRDAFNKEDNSKIYLLFEDGANNTNHKILVFDIATLTVEDTISLPGISYGADMYISRRGRVYWFSQDSDLSGNVLFKVAIFDSSTNTYQAPTTVYSTSNNFSLEHYSSRINEVGNRISLPFMAHHAGVESKINLLTCNNNTCNSELVYSALVDQSGVNHTVNGQEVSAAISDDGSKILVTWSENLYDGLGLNQADIYAKVKYNSVWGSEVIIDGDATDDFLKLNYPVAAIDGSGAAVVIWNYLSETNLGYIESKYYSFYNFTNQTWAAQEQISYTQMSSSSLSEPAKVFNYANGKVLILQPEVTSNVYAMVGTFLNLGVLTGFTDIGGNYSDGSNTMMGGSLEYSFQDNNLYALVNASSGPSVLFSIDSDGGGSYSISGEQEYISKYDGIGIPPQNISPGFSAGVSVFDLEYKTGSLITRHDSAMESNLFQGGTEIALITKYGTNSPQAYDMDLSASGDIVATLVDETVLYQNYFSGGDCSYYYYWGAVLSNSSGTWEDYHPIGYGGTGTGCWSGGNLNDGNYRVLTLSSNVDNQTVVHASQEGMSSNYLIAADSYNHSTFSWNFSQITSFDSNSYQTAYNYSELANGSYKIGGSNSPSDHYYYSSGHVVYSDNNDFILDLDNQQRETRLTASGELSLYFAGNYPTVVDTHGGPVPGIESINGLLGGGYVDVSGSKAVYIFQTMYFDGSNTHHKAYSLVLNTSTLALSLETLFHFQSGDPEYFAINKVLLGKNGSHYVVIQNMVTNAKELRKFNPATDLFDLIYSIPGSSSDSVLAGAVDNSNGVRLVIQTGASTIVSRYFNATTSTWEAAETISTTYQPPAYSSINSGGIKVKRDGTIIIPVMGGIFHIYRQ